MKNENRMMDLFIEFVNKNQDIRLFSMNGSRVNTKIPNDSFKDYDVVFFTDDIQKYQKNTSFLREFGEIILLTEPENGLFPASFLPEEGYIYLVQYMDGNRIDFQFRCLDQLETYIKEDSLTKIILDKDQRVKKQPVLDDSTHWIKKPTQTIFQASIAEFWWQNLNVLKALAREELTLAFSYLTSCREELIRLLTWKTALFYGFNRSYGKQHHQIIALLNQEEKQLLMSTYSGLSVTEMISSLKQMNQLVEKVVPELGNKLNYSYHDYSEVPYLYLKEKGKTELLQG
ncbi:aminoglycoside 6-adenylyltransferase [Enterococcus rivorum]|uniref:Aminoglycoside 6-adenylyltransferase n=1 Tax=Enterococcus rivorum TaxID=762845 RepID=A0A1E5KXL2_9ENTE|nr:aminoglycoside 6-adenylyltransferase [Enterococcus rivorum]MBP2097227.1 aminoglycoside 6-adenylyltransferase [Enterococcus rivorum]OEH82419.1 hypothetical protein BCR26_03015 [Enterococcus rivorum]